MINNITPNICRAARALVGVTQKDLAKRANISTQTLADFERGARTPHANNLLAIQSVLEGEGIEFIVENEAIIGVCLKTVS